MGFRVVPAAYVLLIDGDGRVLLQLRAGTGYRDGFWAAAAAGHVEAGETFRECCVREIEEELELTVGVGFSIAERPFRPEVEYTAMSGGAKVETRYRVELFAVELTTAAVARVNAKPANRWLTPAEIAAGTTTDGQPISAQVRTVFTLNGVM